MIEFKDKNNFKVFIIILFALTLLMIYSFMPLNKLNPGHDVLFHYARVKSLMYSLKEGIYPVYIDFKAYNNYGYAINLFYPDIIFIPFAIIGNFTNFMLAYKLIYGISTLLCGIFTYKMISSIYKNRNAAIFGSLLYTFCTYRLLDLYERAALGEALAFTFIPIIFLGLYKIIKENYKEWYIITIGFSLLLFSHLLCSVLMLITIIIFILIYYKDFIKEPNRIYYLLLSGFITIILCSSFILPFVEQVLNANYELNNIGFDTNSKLNKIEFFKFLVYPHAISVRDKFQPYIGILLTSCLFIRFFIHDKSKYIKSVDIGVIVGLIYIISFLYFIPWHKYPLKWINMIQFSWRLTVFSSFFFAIAGGYYLSKIKLNNSIKIIGISIVIGLLIYTYGYRYQKIFFYKNQLKVETNLISNNNGFTYISSEYLPENLTLDIIKKKGDKIDYQNSSTIISNIKRKEGEISFNIKTSENDTIELPLTYYTGYTAELISNSNNFKIVRPLKVQESKNGLVEVPVNESGNITIKFSGTFIQKYSLYISLFFFLVLIIYILKNKRLKK